MDELKRYSVNFDLSIEKLKENFSETHPKKAYALIEKFLKEEGYEHVQGSGYHSTKKITLTEGLSTLDAMREEYPWLNNSVKSMYLTEIGERFDVTYLYRQDEKLEYSDNEEIEKKSQYKVEEHEQHIKNRSKKISQDLDIEF